MDLVLVAGVNLVFSLVVFVETKVSLANDFAHQQAEAERLNQNFA